MTAERSLLSLAIAAMFAAASFTAAADTPTTANVSTSKPTAETDSSQAQAVQTVATAYDLIEIGDANRDPLSLIVAARILKDTGTRQADAKREVQGGDESESIEAGEDRLAIASVLKRAREYAGERTDLVALIDDVAGAGTRGATAGPRLHTDVVRGQATDRYRITFRAGEPAAVAISGDGDSDLDLYIYDQNGNLICKDLGLTDDAVCRWTPNWTGEFVIDIKNLGIANQYVLAHN